MENTDEKIFGKLYYKDGSLAYEGYFIDDKERGPCCCGLGTQYYPEGGIYREGIFNRKGLLGREYHPDGKLRYQLVLRENINYGPNFPVCGIAYNDFGLKTYSGNFEVRAGGVGYPIVEKPEKFGDVGKYDYRMSTGNRMYIEAPICCDEPDVTYNEWLKFMVSYIRKDPWVSKMMKQGHITETHIITAMINSNDRDSFGEYYQKACKEYEAEKCNLRRNGWTKQQFFERSAIEEARRFPLHWRFIYDQPEKIKRSRPLEKELPVSEATQGKYPDGRLLKFLREEFNLEQDELEKLTAGQANELYEYALACVLEEWPEEEETASERLQLACELMRFLGRDAEAACVGKLLKG